MHVNQLKVSWCSVWDYLKRRTVPVWIKQLYLAIVFFYLGQISHLYLIKSSSKRLCLNHPVHSSFSFPRRTSISCFIPFLSPPSYCTGRAPVSQTGGTHMGELPAGMPAQVPNRSALNPPPPPRHLLMPLQSAAGLPTGQFRWSAVSCHHGHPPRLPLKDNGTVLVTSGSGSSPSIGFSSLIHFLNFIWLFLQQLRSQMFWTVRTSRNPDVNALISDETQKFNFDSFKKSLTSVQPFSSRLKVTQDKDGGRTLLCPPSFVSSQFRVHFGSSKRHVLAPSPTELHSLSFCPTLARLPQGWTGPSQQPQPGDTTHRLVLIVVKEQAKHQKMFLLEAPWDIILTFWGGGTKNLVFWWNPRTSRGPADLQLKKTDVVTNLLLPDLGNVTTVGDLHKKPFEERL